MEKVIKEKLNLTAFKTLPNSALASSVILKIPNIESTLTRKSKIYGF